MFTPDSITYLQAAENFKNGYGISVRDADGFKILTHYPPLYPVILSFFFDNFRLLNSILAFITSFVFGFIVFDATRSIITSILSIIFFSLSPTYIYIFSHLWSETLSLPLILLTCFLIKRYLDHQSTWLLILFSVLISVSTLIRYANLFLIIEEIRKLPQDAYIYSNAPDLIYLHTKRFSSKIPAKYLDGRIISPNFQDKLKEMATKLKEKDGFLVLIYPYSRPYLPAEDELNSLLDLQVYKRTQDGVIYKIRP